MSVDSAPRPEDRQFFDRELSGFVPDRVFDAHCHLWPEGAGPVQSTTGIDGAAGYDTWRSSLRQLLPDRDLAGFFIPWPAADRDPAGSNAWVGRQSREDPRCRCSFVVRPGDDPETVRAEVRRLGARGLKCYHAYSARTPTWDADIPDYLGEPLVRVADEERLAITLHLVKARSVADPSNLRWIREYCLGFPDMTMILAHTARAFQPAHAFEGLPRLADLPNLVVDCSANCEPMAHAAALRILGHRRVLYGSDFPVSHLRGRSVAAADSFLWLYGDTPVWKASYGDIVPVPVGLEHLRSLKWACWSERLADRDVEDVFWNNAASVFGVR
jgi:glutamate-1-semialdehyde 2,1-aminomutase